MTHLGNPGMAGDAGNHGYFCCLATPALRCWACSGPAQPRSAAAPHQLPWHRTSCFANYPAVQEIRIGVGVFIWKKKKTNQTNKRKREGAQLWSLLQQHKPSCSLKAGSGSVCRCKTSFVLWDVSLHKSSFGAGFRGIDWFLSPDTGQVLTN